MFDPIALQQKIQENKQILDKQGANYDNFFRLAYLREGVHKVRIIPDINNELVVFMPTHRLEGTGKKFVCNRKSFDQSADVCPTCKALEEAEAQKVPFDYRWGRSNTSKVLIYLISTNAQQDDYWRVGNYYLLEDNGMRLYRAITDGVSLLFQTASEQPEKANEIMNILNPAVDSSAAFAIQYTYGKGSSGSLTCSVDMFTKGLKLNIPEGKLVDLYKEHLDNSKNYEEEQAQNVAAINKRVFEYLANPSAAAATNNLANTVNTVQAQVNQVPQQPQVASTMTQPHNGFQDHQVPFTPDPVPQPVVQPQVANQGVVPPPSFNMVPPPPVA